MNNWKIKLVIKGKNKMVIILMGYLIYMCYMENMVRFEYER